MTSNNDADHCCDKLRAKIDEWLQWDRVSVLSGKFLHNLLKETKTIRLIESIPVWMSEFFACSVCQFEHYSTNNGNWNPFGQWCSACYLLQWITVDVHFSDIINFRFHLQNEKTRAEIQNLDQQQSYGKLRKLLLNRLSFGTAGLRGVMQAGYNAMNDLVVIQSAQGLVKYIKKCFPSDQLSNGVVFGYDGRYNSKRYLYNIHYRCAENLMLFNFVASLSYLRACSSTKAFQCICMVKW